MARCAHGSHLSKSREFTPAYGTRFLSKLPISIHNHLLYSIQVSLGLERPPFTVIKSQVGLGLLQFRFNYMYVRGKNSAEHSGLFFN